MSGFRFELTCPRDGALTEIEFRSSLTELVLLIDSLHEEDRPAWLVPNTCSDLVESGATTDVPRTAGNGRGTGPNPLEVPT